MLILGVLLAFCLGAFVGKFMAITVRELPPILLEQDCEGEDPREVVSSFFLPRQCEHCHRPVVGFNRLPVIGYLLTKGKCCHCHCSTGVQEVLLELGVALLFGMTVFLFSFTPAVLFVLIVSCLLICCFITDYEHGILPDQFTLSLVWVGLIGSLVPIFSSPQEAIFGAVIGYGIFWLINEFYRYLRHFNGMFPGDFKLNAGVGACIGWKWLLPVLVCSLLFLVVVAIGKFIWQRKMPDASDLHKEVAYSCYVSVIAIIAFYLKLLD